MSRQARWTIAVVILVITAVAAMVRVAGIDFGLPLRFHPDEDMLIVVGSRIAQGDDLNPHFFHWGGAQFYLTALAYRATAIAGVLQGTGDDYLTARLLSAAMGTAAVGLTMLIVLRWYGSLAVTALAGVFFTFTMLHVRLSHYATADVSATTWMLLSIWLLTKSDTSINRWWLAAAGVAAGIAAGTKYHLALFVPVLIATAALLPGHQRHLSRAITAVTVGLATAAGFLASNPFALQDYGAFTTGVNELLTHYNREAMHPRNNATNNWWFFLATLAGGESDAFVLSAAALGLAAWSAAERRPHLWVLAAFPFVTFAYLSTKRANYIRNLLPLLPFLVTAAAIGIVALLRAFRTSALRHAIAAIVIVAIAISVFRVARLDRVLMAEDTRETAGRWLAGHLPPKAKVAVERELWATPPMPDGVEARITILPDQPPSFFRDEGYAYVVTNSVSYRAYFHYPDRMPERTESYRRWFAWLDQEAELLASFTGDTLDLPPNDELPNPEIRVYRLTP